MWLPAFGVESGSAVDTSGKRSAQIVAAYRAVGARDAAIGNPDDLARSMLPAPVRALTWPGISRLAVWLSDRRVPGMFLYHQARTKQMDALFAAGVGAADQVVILGAGLDTRAYRFADVVRHKRVFEVDHPGTAAWKHRRLARLDLPRGHVAYVSMDFTTDSLDERLAAAGYDSAGSTFFLWEGVSMYLPEAAVRATLEFVAQARSSAIVFDYVFASALTDPDRYFGASQYHQEVGRRNEPLRFGVDPSDVADLVADCGLRLAENIGSDALAEQVPDGPICDYFGIARAESV